MQIKDYITIIISGTSLIFSFSILIINFFNYRRNMTKLKIEQLKFESNPLIEKTTPNKLFLNGKQSPDLWNVVPSFHLVIYLKINNLSYTDITISNFIINDALQVSKINIEKLKKELFLSFCPSKKCCSKSFEEYDYSVIMSNTPLKHDDYSLINIGDRIESKSSVEGVIIISGSWSLYNAVRDGINKFTIVTPDKKFDTYVEIDKTIIPKVPKCNILF